jgi:hypothetical protein
MQGFAGQGKVRVQIFAISCCVTLGMSLSLSGSSCIICR